MSVDQQRDERHDFKQRQTTPTGGENYEEIFVWLGG